MLFKVVKGTIACESLECYFGVSRRVHFKTLQYRSSVLF